MSAQIRDGQLILRVPMKATQRDIEDFLKRHHRWIETHMAKAEKSVPASEDLLTVEDIRRLAEEALRVIPQRVAHYAPLVGVTYGKITIRNQRSRWGSCSAGGNLSFNCLLMLTPPEVVDSVVVHELCHRLEMNHSPRFYQEVVRVYPEYHTWNRWLREHGAALMRRMTYLTEKKDIPT